MPRTRPPYSPEFRRQMVDLVRAERSPEVGLVMLGWLASTLAVGGTPGRLLRPRNAGQAGAVQSWAPVLHSVNEAAGAFGDRSDYR